tara:strand:+ start:84 stop:878 length:795 start_codon:yes stop_codon:yes gene_type:complete
MSYRIKNTFSNNEKKLITFVTGGDPNIKTSKKIIDSIAKSGADIIEIGMPFSDPMADGPTIQLSSNRAIKKNVDLNKIFSICKDFRSTNNKVPLILMGYYNVIHYYGIKKFVDKCNNIGIDGLIIVDLQPEEDSDLLTHIKKTQIDLIRLITPTTDEKRLKNILKYSSGFLYYVTITGITGQKSANIKELKHSIKIIKKHTKLPIVCGFGVKNSEQVKEICKISDGVVVGSSIVNIIEKNLKNNKKTISSIEKFVKKLKKGTNQ